MIPVNAISASMPVSEKIRTIEAYIRNVCYGSRTIPVCMVRSGGFSEPLREWRQKDFAGMCLPPFRDNEQGKPPRITGADWLNNENSTSFSGEYLLSQVFRYQAAGDKTALEECSRALRGIRRISELAGPERFGWLCKPWGEKLQESSSPDQNVCAIVSMWRYLPYAAPEEAQFICAIIPAIAAWWKKINYTIVFSDHIWDMQDDTAHMRMYIMFNQLAAKITGEKEYAIEAARLEERYNEPSADSVSLFDTFSERYEGYFDGWRLTMEFAGASLLFAPLQLYIQSELNPGKRESYLAAWRHTMEHGMIGYDSRLGGHYYDTEVINIEGEYHWRPCQTIRPELSHQELIGSTQWAFNLYRHRVLWLDATARLPLSYLLYLESGGEALPAQEKTVREIMDRLDGERIYWMADPHHDQIIPELSYMTQAISSEISNYPAAWHLGCKLNFWS